MKPFRDLKRLLGIKARPECLSADCPLTSTPVYRVGELWRPGRRHWPSGSRYSYGRDGHELTLFHANIDDQLIDDVRRAEAEFALIPMASVLVLAYRFGQSIPWSDTPFCWHLQPAQGRVAPPPEDSPETRALLWITLVGARDGIIHAQRGMTLSPGFTRTLHNAIRAQARTSFNSMACVTAMSTIFLSRAHALDRLEMATASTTGNA